MFDIGGGELLLILIVVLVAFGPKKLPELAQSLGRGIREFKRAQRDFAEQINSAIEQENRKKTRTISRGSEPFAPRASETANAAQAEQWTPPPATIQPPAEERIARMEPPATQEQALSGTGHQPSAPENNQQA